MKLVKAILVGLIIEAVPLFLLLLVLRVVGFHTGVQAAATAGLILLMAVGIWQSNRTTRNADLAAALARGTGTYIIGDKQIRHGNVKPIADRIGVPLAGVQPGAVPRDVITGRPLMTEVNLNGGVTTTARLRDGRYHLDGCSLDTDHSGACVVRASVEGSGPRA